MKKSIYLIILGLAVFSSVAFAMSCGADMSYEGHDKAPQAESAAVDAGNKICPVSGEQIDKDVGEGFKPSPTYEYEGKIYNFCCAGCIDEFKKEPQKYIDKVNQELEAD